MKRAIKLALTGGSGSGKGRVAALLRARGIPCLCSDGLVHRLYRGGALPKELAALFGGGILAPDGSVDRKALGQIVFSDPDARQLLNQTVHRRVREFALRFMNNHIAAGCSTVAVDAPQLYEAGMEGDFDAVIAVLAPEEDRLRRIRRRDGISLEAAQKRLAAQHDEAFFVSHADFLLHNPEGLPEERLEAALEKILRQIAKAEKEGSGC